MVNFLPKAHKIGITVLIKNLHNFVHPYIKVFGPMSENIDNFSFKSVVDFFLVMFKIILTIF